jgi:S-adenosylmethionine:diacylglycerol 3-amino-3-carboxypropyl transferase
VGILFTRAWEDDRLDAELLAVEPGQRVMVVAAAGDAALALAGAGAKVTAVDVSAEQLHLVALKLAVARTLDPIEAHRWFEIGRDREAPARYEAAVRDALPPSDAAYWDTRIRIVADGLHDHAGVGRPFARLGQLARVLRPELARAIETAPDVASQAAWWERHVRPWLFGPWAHVLAARTPVLAPLTPNRFELDRMRRGGWSRGLETRVDGIVGSVLVRRHPWWRPAFSGHAADPGDGAAWLDPQRFGTLARRPRHVHLLEADLVDALGQQRAGSIEAISVSNVPDWLDASKTRRLAIAVRRALAPGGRVLVRRVVRPAGDDSFRMAGLLRDARSDTLVARERTALYEAVDLYRAPA